jgi:hypothetical protein
MLKCRRGCPSFDLADFNNANNHVEKSHFFFGKKLMSLSIMEE